MKERDFFSANQKAHFTAAKGLISGKFWENGNGNKTKMAILPK